MWYHVEKNEKKKGEKKTENKRRWKPTVINSHFNARFFSVKSWQIHWQTDRLDDGMRKQPRLSVKKITYEKFLGIGHSELKSYVIRRERVNIGRQDGDKRCTASHRSPEEGKQTARQAELTCSPCFTPKVTRLQVHSYVRVTVVVFRRFHYSRNIVPRSNTAPD
jgi:hypothetical protein